MDLIFGFIVEILGLLFVDLLYKTILHPLIKATGTTIRWTYFLGNKEWDAVHQEDNNTTVGILFLAGLIALLVLLFS